MGIAEQSKLHSAHFFRKEQESLVGNIYLATVIDIVKNLGAAFVDIAPGQRVFVPLPENQHFYTTNREFDGKLKQQDTVLIQIQKDAVKTKDPCGTGVISIAGNYCAISTGKPGLSISQKLSAKEKTLLKESLMEKFREKCPEALDRFGIIIRTNAKNCLADEAGMATLWHEVSAKIAELDQMLHNACYRTAHSVLFKKKPFYIENLKNGVIGKIDKISTDILYVYEDLVNEFAEDESVSQMLEYYQDERISLSNIYSLHTRIEEILGRKVWLPSGGNLIIDELEAMTVIDVNSAKISAKKSREELFYQINLEACEEIAHQLILRNLAGIIMVDFINMEKKEHQDALMKHLSGLLKQDPVPTRLVDLTPLGIVEITRKRTQPSFHEMYFLESFSC